MGTELRYLALLCGLTAPAIAQEWTAVPLHPPGGLVSLVYAVTPTRQGGIYLPVGGPTNPTLWTGSAGSWTSLLSAGSTAGHIYGMDATRQVGSGGMGAAMWLGTPESKVELHPPSVPFFTSYALAVRGDMQVGRVWYGSALGDRAALWRGTAESYINLHPPGAIRSVATCTDGILQGGAFFVGLGSGTPRAAIWNGTAESMVDLHPPGMVTSGINGMARGVQVGSAFAGAMTRATVWHGTPESWTDLTPPGATGVWLFDATTGRIHVGGGTSGGVLQARANFGTPESWVNLHQFLPAGYNGASRAHAVCQDGDRIYIGGMAMSDATGEYHAFLWIGSIACWANCDESTTAPLLNVADFGCFLQRFAEGDGYANCDRSTTAPTLNVADFSCFLQRFAAGCAR